MVGLKDEAFPRIKLFKKGMDTSKPVDCTGNMKESKDLLDWTVAQTGVFVGVKVGGQLECEGGAGTRYHHRLYKVPQI